MRMASTACTVLISLGLFFPPGGARSQTSTTSSSSNAGSVKTEMVPSLIVLNAGGAKLDGQVLTLDHVAPNAIVFADRPVRAAGHALTQHVPRGMGHRQRQLRQRPAERHSVGARQER